MSLVRAGGALEVIDEACKHSLCLTKLFSFSYPEGNTSCEMVTFVFRPKNRGITNDLRVSIATPPEFPLTLPFSGIVHHPSGPDTYAPLSTFKITGTHRHTQPQPRPPRQPTHITHGDRQRKRIDRKRRSTSRGWEHVPSMMCIVPSL